VAWIIYAYVKRQPDGNDTMRDLAAQIQAGAMAFLRREYSVLIPFIVIVAVLLSLAVGRNTAVAYLAGAACSILAGFFGMTAATRANVRTSEAARAHGQGPALRVAFFGGSVMGLSVASLGLLGIGLVFLWAGQAEGNPVIIRQFAGIISGFAMGASSIALFARVGGGIYTKAADVGADLVGKVEAGIPEDDPRNPATIADNVGDNVGDVAGMGADIFESYVGAVIATIAIAATSSLFMVEQRTAAVVMPIILIIVGLLASLVGIGAMKLLERTNPASALRNTTFIAAGLFLIASYFVIRQLDVFAGSQDFSSLAAGRFGRSRKRPRPVRLPTSSPAWRLEWNRS
jgi:K(+)-stimulated pyrophosphate-energized sodium pump